MSAIRIITVSALITAGLLKGVPALAEPATPPANTSIVRTADLDLSSDGGQRQLEVRLAKAAREVCGTASDVDLEGKNDVRACRDDVLDRARSQRDQLIASKQVGGTVVVAASR